MRRGINLIPAHLFNVVKDTHFDLCCNFVSLGEMSNNHFDEYIKSNLYQKSKYKHIVNRVSSAPFFLRNTESSYSNCQTILDYKFSEKIKYFDIFPLTHFYPLMESKQYEPMYPKLNSINSFLKSWRRVTASSQLFECIFESN